MIEVAERERWQESLHEWQAPDAFRKTLDQIDSRCGDYVVTDSWLKIWREGWLAVRLAEEKSADGVRLVAANRPDFELLIDDETKPFEITEALPKGRQRGKEYAQDRQKIAAGESAVRQHPEEKYLNPEKSFQMLRERAESKAQKDYESGTGLLIYLNDPDFGSHEKEIVNTFRPATELAKDKFSEIWVRWDGEFHQAW